MLFDTHCHLQDRAFKDDVDAVIRKGMASGVVGMTVLGYDPGSNVTALELAERYAGVFPAVGYHPHDASEISDADLGELAALARLPQVVAVGEIGLDFYRMLSPRDRQEEVLEAQLAIALEVAKPVCVHSRSAEEEMLDPLRRFASEWRKRGLNPRPPGVMHCFGGTAAQAAGYADLGFLVSLACTVTYPKSLETQAIAAEIPLPSMVIETDSPYLPPQGIRGQRNEPGNVRAACEAIARLRGTTVDEVARLTTANAERLFAVSVAAPAPASAP